MIDNRIHFREPLVGYGHPYLPDTLNRLALVESNPDGHGRVRYLSAQAEPPATGPHEVALFCRPVGGRLELFMRREANGELVRLTGPQPVRVPAGHPPEDGGFSPRLAANGWPQGPGRA